MSNRLLLQFEIDLSGSRELYFQILEQDLDFFPRGKYSYTSVKSDWRVTSHSYPAIGWETVYLRGKEDRLDNYQRLWEVEDQSTLEEAEEILDVLSEIGRVEGMLVAGRKNLFALWER